MDPPGDVPLPDLPTIHERVEYARRIADLTQEKLADILQVTTRTLRNYETGVTPIPASLVPRIERVAKLPPGWILYDGTAEEWERRAGGRLPPLAGATIAALVAVILAAVLLVLVGSANLDVVRDVAEEFGEAL